MPCWEPHFRNSHRLPRVFPRTVLLNVPFLRNSIDFVFDSRNDHAGDPLRLSHRQMPARTRYFPDASSASAAQSIIYELQDAARHGDALRAPPRRRAAVTQVHALTAGRCPRVSSRRCRPRAPSTSSVGLTSRKSSGSISSARRGAPRADAVCGRTSCCASRRVINRAQPTADRATAVDRARVAPHVERHVSGEPRSARISPCEERLAQRLELVASNST